MTEVTLGQVMQLLMLATVVEAKLMGVNPYGRPSAAVRRKYAQVILKAMNNPS